MYLRLLVAVAAGILLTFVSGEYTIAQLYHPEDWAPDLAILNSRSGFPFPWYEAYDIVCLPDLSRCRLIALEMPRSGGHLNWLFFTYDFFFYTTISYTSAVLFSTISKRIRFSKEETQHGTA